jgi:hypothetical protein
MRFKIGRASSEPADYWYDAEAKYITPYDEPNCHDMLVDLMPIAALKMKLGKESEGRIIPSD